jgi:hypothetical protein
MESGDFQRLNVQEMAKFPCLMNMRFQGEKKEQS